MTDRILSAAVLATLLSIMALAIVGEHQAAARWDALRATPAHH